MRTSRAALSGDNRALTADCWELLSAEDEMGRIVVSKRSGVESGHSE
jgi:hypothetical protein